MEDAGGEEEDSPNARRRDPLEAVTPICAAFCSSAVADMWDGVGGANCRRSCSGENRLDP